MVRESCTQPSGFVIEISLEKRCLHIDRTTGAIAQAACSRTAMQPAHMERVEPLAAPCTLLKLLKAKVCNAAALLSTASLVLVTLAERCFGSLVALPSKKGSRRPLPLLAGIDYPYPCACPFFLTVVLCQAA
jgi:hypothetical protein